MHVTGLVHSPDAVAAVRVDWFPVRAVTVTSGPDGNVWFTVGGRFDRHLDAFVGPYVIGRITPRGKVTRFPLNVPRLGYITRSIASGPDRTLWVAFSRGVARVTTTGKVTQIPLAIPSNCEKTGECGFGLGSHVAPGPDGNMWMTQFGRYFPDAPSAGIWRVTPAGSTTLFTAGITSLTADGVSDAIVRDIVAGGDGNLWLIEDIPSSMPTLGGRAEQLARVTPGGTITEFPLPDVTVVDGIAKDPNGTIWFASVSRDGAQHLGRMTAQGQVTYLGVGAGAFDAGGFVDIGAPLTPGPEGDLWFFANAPQTLAPSLGHITPSGAESIAALPPFAAPFSLTCGPDGALWFTAARTATSPLVAFQPPNALGRISGFDGGRGIPGCPVSRPVMPRKKTPGSNVTPPGGSRPPRCDQSTAHALHYDRWSVRLVTTPHSGTVAASVQLGSRFMADNVSNPFVKIFTRRHPNGVIRYLAPCGYSRLSGPLQRVERRDTRPPLVEFDQKYDVNVDPGNPRPSILEVTQRFIFEKEFVEGLDKNFQDCEPSGQAPVHNPFHHPCARWKLVLSYSFHAGKGDALQAVHAFERLHFHPDHKMVRGAMLTHDCEPVELGDDVGDPCVNGPGGLARLPGIPGIAIFGGENPLRWEVEVGAFRSKCCGVVGEIPGNADNLHLTTQASVGLPVPIPPGCPECIHIHWRWGATIGGSEYGGGEPLLGCWEKAVPCSSAGADQDAQVALVSSSDRQYPLPLGLVGADHNPAVGGISKAYFGTRPLRDPVVWFSSTTERSHANLFQWGGFFCAPMSVRGNTYSC
jgi:virginiamycin B lyase